MVLRYLLKDHEKFFVTSKHIIEQNQIYIPTEVIAEIVYVLEKVYEVPRSEISKALGDLFTYPNITTSDTLVLKESLSVYKAENIDYVDAILVSYARINHDHIYSFDKKVNQLCELNK